MSGILAAVDDPDSDLGPNPRSKLRNAVEYLAVAPQVVAVTRDIDLGPIDATLPHQPADAELVAALAEEFNLNGPVGRLTETLAAR